jgi:D-hydroxyproline dehydrogenase subunit gamma
MLRVDGLTITAHEGEMLAAALLAAGILELRRSPEARTSRGAFCFMGVCQECVVRVEGETGQACLVAVKEGLNVELVPPYEAKA